MSSHSTKDKLIYMANQMDSFFKYQDEQTAPTKIAEHIRKFWDPRMRKEIIAHLETGGAGLNPNSKQAIEILRAGA